MITGFVLAGGKSSRMGQDKAFIYYENKFLFVHSVEKIKFFCDKIIISSTNKRFVELGYEILVDKFSNCGPMCGIYSCLLNSSTEKNLFIPCDTPFIPSELFADLYNCH